MVTREFEMQSRDNDLISIAMCTYNGAQYLVEQLDSIINQSYKNIEIIIVDDCSTDETLNILEGYARQDTRIRVVNNEVNLGFVKNFEKAINECRGDLIALADQDDIWFESKITRLVENIGDNWLIYSKVAVIDKRGVRSDEVFPSVNRLEGHCTLSLILNNCVTGHACLMRRDLLGLAMPVMSQVPYHDQWFAIVAASRGKLKAYDEVLSLYRKHATNAVLSTKIKRRESKYLHAAKKFQKSCDFIKLILSSGILNNKDQSLIEEFYQIYIRNDTVVYNFKLSIFLIEHQDDFLALFNNPERFVKKLCRGKWYFILIPFA